MAEPACNGLELSDGKRAIQASGRIAMMLIVLAAVLGGQFAMMKTLTPTEHALVELRTEITTALNAIRDDHKINRQRLQQISLCLVDLVDINQEPIPTRKAIMRDSPWCKKMTQEYTMPHDHEGEMKH